MNQKRIDLASCSDEELKKMINDMEKKGEEKIAEATVVSPVFPERERESELTLKARRKKSSKPRFEDSRSDATVRIIISKTVYNQLMFLRAYLSEHGRNESMRTLVDNIICDHIKSNYKEFYSSLSVMLNIK